LYPTLTRTATGKHSYQHHFSVTQDYIIFIESPAYFPQDFTDKFWSSFTWAGATTPTYITVLDRKTKDEENRFIVQKSFFAFHHVNAWLDEALQTIYLDVLAYPNIDTLPSFYLKNILNKTNSNTAHVLEQVRLTRFTLSLNAARDTNVTGHVLSDQAFELPVINRAFHTKPYRYVWGAGFCGEESVFMDCVIKLDVETRQTKSWKAFRTFPGEPLHVADPGSKAEDSGSVVSVVLDGRAASSYVQVLLASDLSKQVKILLPDNYVVPLGFHGAIYPTPTA